MQRLVCILTLMFLGTSTVAQAAGPRYDQDRKELESILDDLTRWLPGEWSSFPQIYYERTVKMPADGEHDPWHRTFVRIKAPQIGEYVFYGQINLGGGDGPLVSGSQILYTAGIDEQRQVVVIHGQAPAEQEKYVGLQGRPELWSQVRMRDPSNIRCDFIWRREGAQIVGVLDGSTEERRKYGPGTCSYVSQQTGKEFFAETHWALSADELWLYDINSLGGVQFTGRKDHTHTKLYRARPYQCTVRDAAGRHDVAAHDRGFSESVVGVAKKSVEWMLLRARFPAARGFGLEDRLKLLLTTYGDLRPVEAASAAPAAASISGHSAGVAVRCSLSAQFPSVPAP